MGKGTVANLAMTEARIGDVAGFAMARGIVNRRGASFPVELILCADRIIRLGARLRNRRQRRRSQSGGVHLQEWGAQVNASPQ